MKKTFAILILVVGFVTVSAQETILTAANFFKKVSDKYAAITDYEAEMFIRADKSSMQAHVSYKKPHLLRLDFSNPDEQVILFNGDQMTIYLPGSQAVLSQSVETGSGTGGANIVSSRGLTLMSRYYYVAYQVGQTPVPLEEGSSEQVVKLLLSRKSAAEGFRTIKLSINPNSLLIRRVEAVMATTGQNFLFDFTNYAINQNIPDTRFIYDSPSSANIYNNFLFME